MKIKFDPLIIFFFGLVAGIILSPIVRPHVASASTNPLVQVGTSTFILSTTVNLNSTIGGTGFHFNLYQNQYLQTGNLIAGANTLGTYPNPVGELALSVCQSRTINTITCNPEIHTDTDGVFWFSLLYPGGLEEWYQLRRTGGVWSSDYQAVVGGNNIGFSRNTRFLSLNATNSATVGDVDFDISWYLDPNEVNRQVSALNPTAVKIRWVETGNTIQQGRSFAIASTTGTSSDTFVITDFPPDGTVTAMVTFTNTGCDFQLNSCPFPDSYIYLDILMASGTIASTSAVEYYDTVDVLPEEETCSLTNISACINNALIYLFVPSGDALDEYINLGDRLDTVKPFGYFTQALEAIGTVSTTTSAYTMPEIPFQTAIFDPLRDGMSVMLWGIFAFVFYNKRLKNIDI